MSSTLPLWAKLIVKGANRASTAAQRDVEERKQMVLEAAVKIVGDAAISQFVEVEDVRGLAGSADLGEDAGDNENAIWKNVLLVAGHVLRERFPEHCDSLQMQLLGQRTEMIGLSTICVLPSNHPWVARRMESVAVAGPGGSKKKYHITVPTFRMHEKSWLRNFRETALAREGVVAKALLLELVCSTMATVPRFRDGRYSSSEGELLQDLGMVYDVYREALGKDGGTLMKDCLYNL